jgi:hypothetical protein
VPTSLQLTHSDERKFKHNIRADEPLPRVEGKEGTATTCQIGRYVLDPPPSQGLHCESVGRVLRREVLISNIVCYALPT